MTENLSDELDRNLQDEPILDSHKKGAAPVSESGLSFIPPWSSKRPFIPGWGVSELAKKPILKIGVVSIKDCGSRKWSLRYVDPATGSDVRRRLSGLELREVQTIASHLSQEALSEKGFIPGRKKACPTVKEALLESIRLSRQRDYVKTDSTKRANLFTTWLEKRFPKVEVWSDLKPFVLQEYIRDMEARGLSHYSVRNNLRPVKAAWHFVYQNYPEAVRPLPMIRQASSPPRGIECLEPAEVRALLDWLRGKHPDLWAMASLQALAGLRVLEAASLRRQDIDLAKGTVTVTDTGHHVPKNRGSYRTLPVCAEVLEALAEAMNRQKVIPSTGELFLSRLGTPWTVTSLYHRWKKKPTEAKSPKGKPDRGGVLYLAAKETGIAKLAGMEPHSLRAAFATMASRLEVPDRLLKSYLGHTPGDVLGEHYRVIGLDDLRLVSSLMNGWRTLSEGAGFGKILATRKG